MTRFRAFTATLCLLLTASPLPAFAETGDTPAAAARPDYPQPMFGGWGVNPADIDRTARPGDDFFAYVNGKWARAEVIPE